MAFVVPTWSSRLLQLVSRDGHVTRALFFPAESPHVYVCSMFHVLYLLRTIKIVYMLWHPAIRQGERQEVAVIFT